MYAQRLSLECRGNGARSAVHKEATHGTAEEVTESTGFLTGMTGNLTPSSVVSRDTSLSLLI